MSERLFELRRAFDSTFASPPAGDAGPVEDFLAVRIAGDLCALRVRDVALVAVDCPVVPVPSRHPELLGLAGMPRGAVPVFSLARLLGLAPGGEPARWLVCCGRPPEVAFAVDELQRYLRVPAASVTRVEPGDDRRTPAGELVQDGLVTRAVIDLPAVVARIAAPSA